MVTVFSKETFNLEFQIFIILESLIVKFIILEILENVSLRDTFGLNSKKFKLWKVSFQKILSL